MTTATHYPAIGIAERRSETRLRYSWQMYFQHPDDGRVEQGRMVDLSSRATAFLVGGDSALWPGKRLFLRITHPMVRGEAFNIAELRRAGEVIRVDPYVGHQKRVAVRLLCPLDYNPVGDSCDLCGPPG
jgi:hypothetical protein